MEITAAEYGALMEAQHAGRMIQADADGRPVAVDRLAPTGEEQAATIRAERDRRIAATDYLLMADYPIAVEALEAVKVYRQALRDITAQDGFPWGGESAAAPWPEKPAI